MKILFFINALEHGGAARVLVTLSNELASRGHSVYIMADVLYKKVNFLVNDNVILVPRIKTQYTKFNKQLQRILGFIRIRKKLKIIKPDIVIGFMPRNYFLLKILSIGLPSIVIASERNSYHNNKDIYEYLIRKLFYPLADAVTFLSKRDIYYLGNKLPQKTVMHNPIIFSISDEKLARNKSILAAGRLDGWHHKGFDSLLSVWSRLAKKYIDWTLEIAGDGSNESSDFLKNMVTKYGIEDRVVFLGFRSDMQYLFQTSSIFVLSSRYEGMCNVLLEAMSQGCACISFELDGRTNEIITSSDVGIVVKDQNLDDLEKAIAYLIENESQRESLGEKAKQEATRFSKDKITDNWEELFNSLMANKQD